MTSTRGAWTTGLLAATGLCLVLAGAISGHGALIVPGLLSLVPVSARIARGQASRTPRLELEGEHSGTSSAATKGWSRRGVFILSGALLSGALMFFGASAAGFAEHADGGSSRTLAVGVLGAVAGALLLLWGLGFLFAAVARPGLWP